MNRFNLSGGVTYRKDFLDKGTNSPGELDLTLIGSGRVGDVRLRGTTDIGVAPGRLRTAELDAYWSAGENVDWEGDLAYDGSDHRARTRISYIRRFDGLALALTGEAATDGSVAFGINLNFSMDPRRGLSFSRRPLASAGEVRATVYRDLNDNGVKDPGEPVEKGAMVTTGAMQAEQPTGKDGTVMVGGLTVFAPVPVGVDEASLSDPMLTPAKKLQVVVPRPGIPAEVQIGLVGGGDIEGAVVKSGGIGFEGLDLELVDAAGKLVATTRTDFDGFFLFERVTYGSYTIRVSEKSAIAARIAPALGLHAEVTPDKAVVRLGTTQVTPLPKLASADTAPAGTP